MSLLKITNGFERKSDSKLIERANFIHQQVVTRTSVFATPRPTMAELKDGIDDYQSTVNAAINRDRVLVEQKNLARQKVIDLLHSLGYYVLYTANGDRLIALESGFTIAKEPTPVIITKPGGLKVENSDQTGQLLVSVKRVPGARAYTHQYSTDPLLKEESWQSMNCTAAKCKLTGLKPGTAYYVRVGAIGSNEQVLYSDVVSRIAA